LSDNIKANPDDFPTNKRRLGTAFRIAICVLILGACMAWSGCDPAHETIRSTEARSPNGYWLASSSTVRYTGPGNAAVITTVYLQRADESKPRVKILEFFHNGIGSQAGIDLQIQWSSPTHLLVTYNGNASIDFQAVKSADVDISLNNSQMAR
jgi:hypothetical protein